MKSDEMLAVAKSLNMHSEGDLFAAIGYGHLATATVINRLKIEGAPKPQSFLVEAPAKPSGAKKLAITLDGAKNLMVTRAKCCAPVPGEEVVGYISRGKGVALHTDTCPNVAVFRANEPERLVNIDWAPSDGERYPTEVRIQALDRVGVLNDITAVLSEVKTNITSARVKSTRDKTANIDLTVTVPDLTMLEQILTRVGNLPNVLKIERISAHSSRGAGH